MAAPEEKQTGGSDEGDSDSNYNKTTELTAAPRGHQPADGGDTTQADDDTEATSVVTRAADDTETKAVVRLKQNFNEFTLITVTHWVYRLDKVVAARWAGDPPTSSVHWITG